MERRIPKESSGKLSSMMQWLHSHAGLCSALVLCNEPYACVLCGCGMYGDRQHLYLAMVSIGPNHFPQVAI